MDFRKLQFLLNRLSSSKYVETFNYGVSISKALTLVTENTHNLVRDNHKESLFKMRVEERFCDSIGVMHGGAIITLFDITNSLSIAALDKSNRANVTVELKTKYLNQIKQNDEIFIRCRKVHINNSIAHSTGEIYLNISENFIICAKSYQISSLILDKNFQL